VLAVSCLTGTYAVCIGLHYIPLHVPPSLRVISTVSGILLASVYADYFRNIIYIPDVRVSKNSHAQRFGVPGNDGRTKQTYRYNELANDFTREENGHQFNLKVWLFTSHMQ